jgi:hypothetical protein
MIGLVRFAWVLNGKPDVDESGAVRGPSSYDVCCQVVSFLVGVEGGVSPSASVVSSQTGNASPMLDNGEMIGAEREMFIIAEWARACLPLLERGTGTALEGAGVGVPTAAAAVGR